MKKLILTFAVGGLFLFSGAAQADMTLSSPDVQADKPLPETFVFNGFGCTGGNTSPALSWDGVPENAKSLAVTIYDPDAPTGSGWWHWVAFNIPVATKNLEAGASLKTMPAGTIESITDFGAAGFGGACPPMGDKPHHYIMTLYALDVEKLDVDEKASGAMVGYYLNSHKIGTAQITGLYGR